jgi:hypothetical protein
MRQARCGVAKLASGSARLPYWEPVGSLEDMIIPSVEITKWLCH